MPLEKREEVAREVKSTHFSLGNDKSKHSNLRRFVIVGPGFVLETRCSF